MAYLDKFPTFTPDPTTSLAAEFKRLAVHQQWKTKSTKYKKERVKFMEQAFKDQYGADESKLEAWQALCEDLGFDDVPESITKCKKA